MIHTIDTLPAYLYFKIVEEGNLELLTDEKDIDVAKLWKSIYGEVAGLLNSKEGDKIFNLGKAIHQLSSRIEVVLNSIFLLRRKRDKVIEEVLKGHNYILRDAYFQSDLDQIEREINNLEIKIARYKIQLKPLLAQKGDIKKHLQRKYPCKSIHSDVSVKELLEKLNKPKEGFACNKCNKI